jgi:crossover junction endodeoxyribonuclease RuvC
MYIGIDPGATGAVGFVTPYGKFHAVFPSPRIGKEPDIPAMARLIRENSGREAFAVLEKVHAMPGQGVVSMFTFGRNYGLWQGILVALEIPYLLVTPQGWKKEMLTGTKKEKADAQAIAASLWPAHSHLWTTAASHAGRAEALLMAEYARRVNAPAG